MKHEQTNGSIIEMMNDPLSFVTNYRKNIDQQLQKIENDLNQHLTRFQTVTGNRNHHKFNVWIYQPC
jgi:hypothetical protein